MSLQYQTASATTMLHRKCQFTTTLLLLPAIWTMMFTRAMARPNLEALSAKQNGVSQLLLDGAWSTSGDEMFLQSRKSHQQRRNYMTKWPELQDIIVSFNNNEDGNIPKAGQSSIYFDSLRWLYAIPPNYISVDKRQNTADEDQSILPFKPFTWKEHNAKRNIQYMTPCYFKLCSMARQRNMHFTTKKNF
ncbi:CNMamide [Haematobia irritans]|uniref:CNMamide n=1 Tax=Haematobia irritans TaxID=7368 RepID=UPI003F50C65B